MMITVDVRNVGHGDAIRVDFGKKHSVLRDFGRSHSAVDTATSTDITTLIKQNFFCRRWPTDALLSHPHEDHYNGFRELSNQGKTKIFSTSYMPWLDFRDVKALGWQMSILGAYLYAYYAKSTRQHSTVNNWIRSAPIMATLGNSFHGVAARHVLPWPGKSIVLWPPPPASVSKSVSASQSTRMHISRIEALLAEENRKDITGGIRDIGRNIAKILSKYYPAEPTKIITETPDRQDDVAAIDGLLEQLSDIKTTKSHQLNQTHLSAWQHFYTNVDDHSIVFEVADIALFLSDINQARINEMARKYMKDNREYALLKSSHHGTRIGQRDFKTKFKTLKTVLHNCGRAHPRYTGPIRAYCDLNPMEIYCTDKHPAAERLPPGYRYQYCGSAKQFVI